MALDAVPPPRLPVDAAAAQGVILSGHDGRRRRRRRGHSDRGRIADPRRFSDQMLGNERIEDQENDARNEEKQRERGHIVKLGPILGGRGSARRLRVARHDIVLCQAEDWTVGATEQKKNKKRILELLIRDVVLSL